ncbi:phage tail sheath family protein [Mucilaginibacter phyllosphaerae]|uniref:Phage tail sheath family protein n=1 Tax=Mucilaginibacter phyllosphaerae TaxID=1812349 RepID=A0A4Y8ABR9_9SPHI|nr:phage tail sheath C-terminal domain-containing protein [Mucilaginibacter phyllosphaerae]MBB3969172.1 hypothetical protein [Mucilaginibacter phyllosphaerae]TEW66021.1 phage tail sheath family protein [Mucilaginibacter phyllosphaerae]GGH06773.1 hypothetical protein GCM10007352_11150 [Mucilaginibacter phyllosphaerae]
MATSYSTPGVYVEEVSTLPPSIVQASTAIPVFLGYTQLTAYNGRELKNVPTRISSMLEYKQYFGGPAPAKVTVESKKTDEITKPVVKLEPSAHKMYYALELFFRNGGSNCYVLSLGTYATAKIAKDFTDGLVVLAKEEEPTLIVLSEAASLGSAIYYPICNEALKHCTLFKNRFCIIDVLDNDRNATILGATFRAAVAGNLKYGAAYYPALKTSLSYIIEDADVKITQADKTEKTLLSIKESDTAFYNAVKLELSNPQFNVELPPSPAVAGVYATVDAERGVWKAPANVSLNAVIGPVVKITAAEQEGLNIDSTGGKSINAIRSFTGRGTLVWGARTLAGNDNEWRYVSVRRLFNMIEESAAKATFFAVFEPNDATTWLKVKSMIESFLYGLWQQGALAGSTAKASYFVKVGLGATMTNQDILEGKMIIEIGIAAVRPAEFIILRFSHKLQEA